MNFLRIAGGVVLLVCCSSNFAISAEFSYSVDIKVYYQGALPADGKYLKQNFLITAKTQGIAPKNLNVLIDLSSGPGTPVLQQGSCGVGELQPGWTAAYGGASCNWPDVVTLPAGKKLYAASSANFAPFAKGEQPSTVPVVSEAIKPFPDDGATVCAAPKAKGVHPSKGVGVTLNVYQLEGVVAADGTIDQSKVCVVATPHGADAVGLRLWGSLVARDHGKESYVGTYVCVPIDAPDKAVAGTPVVCSPRGNNGVPEKMWMPKQAKLFVASTVTFGLASTTPANPVPVQSYGVGMPNPK